MQGKNKEFSIGIPGLPGNNFNDPLKQSFRKPHSLDFKNGYSLKKKPIAGIGGEPLESLEKVSDEELKKMLQSPSFLTYGPPKNVPESKFVPAHVAFDKMTLCFNAYFKETVHESAVEQYRVRKVKIMYHLEDDSMTVMEPAVENSGMPQGVLIKRQRVPKNELGDTYSWRDLNRGIDILIYGKVLRIASCDKFTEEYIIKQGLEMNPEETIPNDPYTTKRNRPNNKILSSAHSDKLKKFLENDRKVLRFYCIWDDRDTMFGECRPFILHFYLVDDTVEVREVQSQNCGRDPFPVLVKRQKLPKQFNDIRQLDSSAQTEFCGPVDFAIGVTLNIFGRRFLLYDCDNYTRSYYKENFGIEEMDPIPVNEPAPPKASKIPPPYNGFGSELDSLGSCNSLVPKPPRKDFKKMLENENNILRFEADMVSSKPEDQGRKFIVQFRLSDDTITIHEPPQRNAGIMGGKFLQRTRCKKPEIDSQGLPLYYGPEDLFIGAKLTINSHVFTLKDADEFSINFMENNSELFPHSSIAKITQKILEKLAEVETGLMEQAQSDKCTGSAITSVLEIEVGLNKHELITVHRYVAHLADDCGAINIQEFISKLRS
eukprot:Nk52_evm55s554 gene=Nk52_evmTU55s554